MKLNTIIRITLIPVKNITEYRRVDSNHVALTLKTNIEPWRFQHANAPPAKLKNIFVKTLKRGTKI